MSGRKKFKKSPRGSLPWGCAVCYNGDTELITAGKKCQESPRDRLCGGSIACYDSGTANLDRFQARPTWEISIDSSHRRNTAFWLRHAMITNPPAIPKPFLRWAGSKRKQIPRLREFWSADYERYVEPFAGSACFFFSLCPEKALLADKNADLIGAFECVRDDPSRLYDCVVAIPRTKERYYVERARNPATLTPTQCAARFIYLNRNCFNGIYRTNRSGQFNVPFAASRAGAFVTRNEFIEASKSLQRATLRAWDFGTTLRYVRDGDFVYLDPPYVVESRRVFREYGERPFCAKDLSRLEEHLVKIDQRGAAFVVSYADCREARSLAVNWNSCRMRVRRHIAGFSGARRTAYELLVSNLRIPK